MSNLLAHALVAFGGYFLLGGVKLFTEHSSATVVAEPTDTVDAAVRGAALVHDSP